MNILVGMYLSLGYILLVRIIFITSTYTHTHTHTHSCWYAPTYSHTHTHTHTTHTHTYIYIYMHKHTEIFAHTHIYAHIYTNTHTHKKLKKKSLRGATYFKIYFYSFFGPTTNIYIYIYIYIHAQIQLYSNTHKHIQTQGWVEKDISGTVHMITSYLFLWHLLPMRSMFYNIDGRPSWTARETMLKNRSRLITFP